MMCLMATPSGEAAQTFAYATSKWGLDREARAALFRVKTGPECPKGTNLRWQPGLWDSQREREKRERKNYPMKSPNLRHHQARPQNKGLSRTSWLRTGPSTAGDRQARAARAEGGNCGPREASCSKLQADFIANQDFLGFWIVDIRQEGRSQRSAPQKRPMAYLKWGASCHPVNRAAGTGEVIRCTTPKESALAKHLVT